MANQDVRVSALQSASTLSTDDLALATVVDELSETGYTSKKITEGAKASQYLEAFTFANLNTTAKTIVGAINEAATTGGSDEFIIHMTDTTVTETAADIIDAFDNGSEIWLESQITGETVKTRLPLLAYISDSSQLVLRFSGITYANNRYRYCDVQMLRSPEQIVGRQNVNVAFAVIDDATTSSSSVWSSQKTASELADKAEIDDDAVSSSTAWSSEQIVSLLPTESASGAVANFNDGADDVPVKSLLVDIDYKDTTGFNAVNVTRTGKNLAPITAVPKTTGVAFTINDDGTITANGSQSTQVIYEVSSFTAEKNMSVIYSGCTGGSISTFSINMRVNNAYLGDVTDGDSDAKTINKGNVVKFLIVVRANAVVNNVIFKPMIRFASETDDTFEPYTGTTSTINLGSTIYGGSVDITNGTVTSTKAQDGTDLPEPTVTQITPTELSTLYGVNNIWADTGDVTVDYRADVQKYIDSRLSSGTRSLSLAKPVETEEAKQEEQEGDEDVNR